MCELAFLIKLSAGLIGLAESKRKIKIVKITCIVATVFFFGILIFEGFNTHLVVKRLREEEEYGHWRDYLWYTFGPFVLIFTSISLCVAYWFFSNSIHEHFAAQLQDEARRVKAVFILFSLSYISRTLIYLLFAFLSTKIDNTHSFAVFYLLYFFWDILPLTLIMKFHNFCFAAQEKYLREQEEEEESEPLRLTTASSFPASSSYDETSGNETETESEESFAR